MSDVFDARCWDPIVKFHTVTFPPDEIRPNATSHSLAQYFIYLVSGLFRDANRCEFLRVKLSLYRRLV